MARYLRNTESNAITVVQDDDDATWHTLLAQKTTPPNANTSAKPLYEETSEAWVLEHGGASSTAPSAGSSGVILPWVTGTVYKTGQAVTNGGKTWLAVDDHTSGATFSGDSAHWALLPIPSVTTSVATKTGPYTITGSDDVVLADATGTPSPTALAVTASGSGGTFAAATYYWTVTATPPGGRESVISNEVYVAIAANGSAALAWTPASGSGSGWVYKVYRSLLSGQQNKAPRYAGAPTAGLVATLGNVASYTDTGTAISAGAAPAGGFALTLPTAVGATKPVTIKAVHSLPYVVTLGTTGGQTINGGSSVTLGPPNSGATYRAVTVASDGTNWRTI